MGSVGSCMSRKRSPDDDSHAIRKRSKADTGGLAEGDKLQSVNGQPVDKSSHVQTMATIDAAGDTLSLGVDRGSSCVEIPVVMQTSVTSLPPLDGGKISEQTVSRMMSDGTRITVSSSENVTSRSYVDPRFVEENKRAMRERYAISNVFNDNTTPKAADIGLKIRSEENLRSTSSNTPMFKSIVTAQIGGNTDKENVSPVKEPEVKPIPVFNVRKLPVHVQKDGSEMHRSMDEGLSSYGGLGVKRDKHRVPVFGPPVQISLKQQTLNGLSASDPSLKKKLFSDSAFYDDARSSYPTIEEQMKLCQVISQSLTANANKKARGARMFAKRQKRSPFWVHEGQYSGPSSEFSSEGDASYIEELNSELSIEEGGDKPLFQFRIPKLAQQIAPFNPDAKMSLSRSEFENLRLNKQRCEHNAVSPVTCFNLAADLQNSKGRGAKIFEKRRQHANEWVVDEKNVKKANPPENKLKMMIENKKKSAVSTPWDEAARNQTFYPTSSYQSNQSSPHLNPPVETPTVRIADLTASTKPTLLEGPTFNRTAKGWSSVKESPDGSHSTTVRMSSTTTHSSPPVPPPKPLKQYRDYNNSPKAWRPNDPFHHAQDSYNTFPRSRKPQAGESAHVMHTSQTSYHSYPTDFMDVGTDL